MGIITDVWEWLSKPSSWAILLVLFIAWRIKTLLGVSATELFLRRQRGIEQIIPAHGYKASLYIGVDTSDTRSAFRRRAEDYEYLPVIAWGLKQDGSLTGLVHTTDGVKPAETLDNFEAYITSKYAQELTERAKRIGEEDAVLRQLQHMGLYDGAIEDGLYTWKARAALHKFQKSKGLLVTGTLDAATKQALAQSPPVSYPVEVRLDYGHWGNLIIDLGKWKDLTEAKVIRLLVRQDETVYARQPLAELDVDTTQWTEMWVDTNQIMIELCAPCDGVVLNVTVGEGETIQVGSFIAVIGPQRD